MEIPEDYNKMAKVIAEAQVPEDSYTGMGSRDDAVKNRSQELASELMELRKAVEKGYALLLEEIQQREAGGQLGEVTMGDEEGDAGQTGTLDERLSGFGPVDGMDPGKIIFRP